MSVENWTMRAADEESPPHDTRVQIEDNTLTSDAVVREDAISKSDGTIRVEKALRGAQNPEDDGVHAEDSALSPDGENTEDATFEQGRKADESPLLGTTDPSSTTGTRLHHLDGIRAIAILVVVAYHFDVSILRSGYVGVDMFFVLSGFLMTRIIRRNVTSLESLPSFYYRRFWRLVPASLVAVIAALAVAYVILPPIPTLVNAAAAGSSLLFASNMFFYRYVGYTFPRAKVQPAIHTWSLGVEEQFYFFWPLFLLLLARSDPSLLVGKQDMQKLEAGSTSEVRPRSRIVLGILIGLSALFNTAYTLINPVGSFYILPTRTFELAAGGMAELVYESYEAHGKQSRRFSEAVSATGAIVALASFVIPYIVYPGPFAFPIVFASVCLILTPHATVSRSVLSHRFLAVIAKYSYSTYLVHWPIWVLLSQINAVLDYPKIVLQLVSFAATILATLVLFHGVEAPARYRERKPIILTLLAYAVIVFATWTCLRTAGWSFRYSKREAVGAYCTKRNPSANLIQALELSPWDTPANLYSSLYAKDRPKEKHFHSFSSNATGYNTVIVGSSFAGRLACTMKTLERDIGFTFLATWKEGCDVLEIPAETSTEAAEHTNHETGPPAWPNVSNKHWLFRQRCKLEMEVRLNFLRSLPRGQMVYLVITFEERFGNADKYVTEFTEHVQALGHRVVYVTPAPGYEVNDLTTSCNTAAEQVLFKWLSSLTGRAATSPSDIVAKYCPTHHHPNRASLDGRLRALKLAQRFDDVQVLDLFPYFCENPAASWKDMRCVTHDGVTPLYDDTIHMSRAGSVRLAHLLQNASIPMRT